MPTETWKSTSQKNMLGFVLDLVDWGAGVEAFEDSGLEGVPQIIDKKS